VLRIDVTMVAVPEHDAAFFKAVAEQFNSISLGIPAHVLAEMKEGSLPQEKLLEESRRFHIWKGEPRIRMREVYHLKGKRRDVSHIEDALRLVRQHYPSAMKQGSLGAWSFYLPPWKHDNIVAEAWVKSRGPGWWLVIKDDK